MAKKIIIAGTQNIKSNIQYYNRRYDTIDLSGIVKSFAEYKKMMNEADSIEHLLLIEARMRGTYFSCFDSILHADDFKFEKRSRHPPKNEVNAMISFGNTILYGYIADAILKTDLDIRIAFLHAANRRSQSLNLDIAELFKPVIIDRLIFALINKHIIVAHKHFLANDGGSVLLNREGKRIFLAAFKDKISQKIDVNGEKLSYEQLINREVWNLRRHIIEEAVFSCDFVQIMEYILSMIHRGCPQRQLRVFWCFSAFVKNSSAGKLGLTRNLFCDRL